MATKKILLVDDHSGFRGTAQELLTLNGYQVLTAATAAEALSLAEQVELDLAILDVRLIDPTDEKDRSGLELARRLDAELPKIILTAFAAEDVSLLREVLSPVQGKPLAMSLCSKTEGLEELLRAINTVLGASDQHVPKVFLSHSSEDKTLARKIQIALQGSGLNVWNPDSETFPGDNWAKIRGQALETSNAMIVLLSPESVNSGEVRSDIQYALGNRAYENRLVPVLVGDPQRIPQQKIPWILRKSKMITLPDREAGEGFQQIVEALKPVA